MSRCLRDPEDFQIVVADFMAEQKRLNICYTEAHFTISTHAANGANVEEVGDAMAEAIAEGQRRWETRLALIPDIVRNAEFARADLTLEWALANRHRTVVALGLGGKESHSSRPFRSHFETAAREGLARVAHAGEQQGAESIRATFADCAPQRLGHGIRAVDDPALMRWLREERVPIEVCPTSNLRLGLVEDLASHPFGELHRAGLEVSLNTDDPALFETDLVREIATTARAFDLGPTEVCRLTLSALRHSFLPDDEKRRLRREIELAGRELSVELFGEALGELDPVGRGDKPGAV